jgi:hypothetical protein
MSEVVGSSIDWIVEIDVGLRNWREAAGGAALTSTVIFNVCEL